MILRISSSLIKEVNRLARQLQELSLKPNIANLSNFLLAITPVILKEERDRGSRVPVCAIQRQFKDISARNGLRDLDGLGRGELRGS